LKKVRTFWTLLELIDYLQTPHKTNHKKKCSNLPARHKNKDYAFFIFTSFSMDLAMNV
jgi:hypothetical protein